ncbi:ankyrin-2 [Cercophora samala]|uniref:Ankyrin-2 n=1 Tax=Cercophora samala TaxID=330535 RepID=A0AA39ZF09_9PEZI|nr:ankyrin-2 [Cercophora samala]
MDTDMQMDVDVVGSDEDVDFIDVDDVSTYNPDNILPKTPQVIASIRKWLQPTSYNIEGGEYRRHLASHTPGTGHWLPTTAEYAQWHDGDDHGLLWIKGIPGSGKSVYAASLAHDLAKEGHPVLFFFFRQIIDANHTPFNLLCDWLDQILDYSPPLQQILEAYVDDKSDARRDLNSVSRNDLWMHLKTALAQTVGRVYLVADALDEMDSGNDDFLQELAMLGSWKPAKVKVLITSRPVTTVEEPLRRIPALQICLEELLVDTDIATFVRASLESSSISAEDQIRIREAVPGRANGLFLYAKLAMDAFLERDADVHKVLTALPLDLNAMYTDLLREHAQRSHVPADLQLLILSWVTHATRPLRLLELAAIINTSYDDEDMDMRQAKQLARAACGPLLEIQPDETVSVVHHSLTEFLLGSTRSTDADCYSILAPGPTHETLSLSCLRYLSSGCLDDIKVVKTQEGTSNFNHKLPETVARAHSNTKLKFPFLEYAAQNWTIHAAKSAAAGISSELLPPVLDSFLTPGPRFDAWLDMVWHPMATEGVSPLHAAARYGLTQYVKILAGRPDTVLECLDVLKQTPLYHAADRGQDGTVQALIDAGANPNPDNNAGLTPLHQAARFNHGAVVTVLLASGVDPLTPKTREHPGRRCGNSPTTRGHTPLMYACEAGHLEALESFLPYLVGSEVVQQALRWVIGSRRSNIVKRLIQLPGIDVNTKLHGNTLFFSACLAGDVESMQALVEAGADATMPSSRPRDEYEICMAQFQRNKEYRPLNAFCQGLGRHRSVHLQRQTDVDVAKRGLDLLLRAGADVNERDSDGSMALHSAAESPVLLRLLLAAGADPNAENEDGGTILHIPRADEDGFAINKVLVEEGKADVNKRRKDGKTPLMIYLGGYNVKASIRFLEDFSPDCTLTDDRGNGPLHLAIGQHHISSSRPPDDQIELLDKLIAAGAKLDHRNKAGDMAIHVCQHPAIIAFFVKHGCDIDTRDHSGDTPLTRVIGWRRYGKCLSEDMDRVLELGASIHARDYKGRTLLHKVMMTPTSHQSLTVSAKTAELGLDNLTYLVSLGLELKVLDYSGNTALHELIDNGHSLTHPLKNSVLAAALKMLTQSGVDPDARNHSGRTILHLLPAYFQTGRAFHEVKPTIDLVLAACKNINAADHAGVCPIHLAASQSEELTLSLIEAGADISVVTHKGLTPLHYAAEARQSNVLGILLTAIATGKYGDKKMIIDAAEDEKPFVSMLQGLSTRTALWYACRSGRLESVTLLLDAGAEVARHSAYLLEACSNFEIAEKDLLSSQPRHRNYPDHSEQNLVTTRLGEILDMLVHHGLDVDDLAVRRACRVAIQAKSDYTAFCLAQTMQKSTDQSKGDFWERSSLARHQAANRVLENSDIASMGKDFHQVMQDRPLERLLSAREFEVFERIFSVGDGGCDPAQPSLSGRSTLHTLTSFGYRDLLVKLAKEQHIKNLDDDTWRRKQEDEGHSHRGSISPLVLTACERVLPNMEVLRLLVEELGASVNAHHMKHGFTRWSQGTGYYIGYSPLHYVSQGKHWWHVYQALPYLLSQGANLDARDVQGYTPLHRALSVEPYNTGIFHKEAVKVLLNAGACVDAVSNDGVSCLDLAITIGDKELIQRLMDHGVCITPASMFRAVENGQRDLLEQLLSAGGDPNTPLLVHEAPERTNLSLKRQKARYTARPESFLLYFTATKPMRSNHQSTDSISRKREIQELVGTLLAHGADPFLRITKCSNNHLDAIDDTAAAADKPVTLQETFVLYEILHHGGMSWPFLDVPSLDFERRDSEGMTFLLAACSEAGTFNSQRAGVRTDSEEWFIQHLLWKGADPTALDNTGRNALHILLQNSLPQSWAVVKARPFQVLVDEICRLDRAFINQPDPVTGRTPIHLALCVAANSLKDEWEGIIDVLLSAGADASRADNAGNTCLHLLASSLDIDAHRALFQRFLDMGLDINAPNAKAETPAFHYLGQNSRPERRKTAWQWLMDRGVDPAAKDNRGRGLLHVVAEHETDVVLFAALAEKWGLDPMAPDNERMMSSLDVAAACSNTAVISLFEKGKGGGLVERAKAREKGMRNGHLHSHLYDEDQDL